MFDLEYRSQRVLAKLLLKTDFKVWPIELSDRICYLYLSDEGKPRVFWLYKTDSLNKKLKAHCVREC